MDKVTPTENEQVKQEESLLHVGDRVVLFLHGNEGGIVRWIGFLPDDDSKELTAGVELDNPVGTGTGKYKDERLFYAKHGHAALVPIMALIKEEDYGEAQAASQTSPDQSAGLRRAPHLRRAPGLRRAPQHRDTTNADRRQSSADSTGRATPLGHSSPKTKAGVNTVTESASQGSNHLVVDDDSLTVPAAGGSDGLVMAAAASHVSPTERECVVCHEDFTEPKILPCGHMLCRKCLISWMKTQTEACCPMCRSHILTGSEKVGKTPEEIADGFYTDRYMKAVVEAADFLSRQHACQACVNGAALFWCLTCGDALCSSCTSVHAKLSATSDHSVERLASLTPEQVAVKSMVPCAAHKNRPSHLFCGTHGVAVCLPCARADHRACGEVRYLEDQHKESQGLVSDLVDTLSAAEARMMQKVEQLESRLLSRDDMKQRGLAYVNEKCSRLTKAIMKCRHRLTEQVQKKYSGQQQSAVEEKNSLVNERGKLRLHAQMLSRAQKLPMVEDTEGLKQTVARCVVNADQVDISQDQQLLQPEFSVDENLMAKLEEDLSSAIHIIWVG